MAQAQQDQRDPREQLALLDELVSRVLRDPRVQVVIQDLLGLRVKLEVLDLQVLQGAQAGRELLVLPVVQEAPEAQEVQDALVVLDSLVQLVEQERLDHQAQLEELDQLGQVVNGETLVLPDQEDPKVLQVR